MEGLRIIDMSEDEKPSDFENIGLILIKNIREANIESAVKIAKSAESSRTVTAGILSGNINPLNRNMKKFLDHADAVILLSVANNEYSARIITDTISDLITKAGFVNLDIEDVQEILRNAGTVYYGAGTAKSSGAAALKACDMCGNISGAKRFLTNVTAGPKIMLGELKDVANVIAMNADPNAQIIWGHVIDDDMRGNVRVSIFATMNDKG